VSIHFDASRDRFVVRWKEDGRRRVRRFRSEADAIAFDASLLRPVRHPPIAPAMPTPAAGDGIYAYETRNGTRYRFVFRQSDGKRPQGVRS
jgi:Ser/Thr protein kinase RdoA (MazF antagonist)